jgi:hypothetical protein
MRADRHRVVHAANHVGADIDRARIFLTAAMYFRFRRRGSRTEGDAPQLSQRTQYSQSLLAPSPHDISGATLNGLHPLRRSMMGVAQTEGD